MMNLYEVDLRQARRVRVSVFADTASDAGRRALQMEQGTVEAAGNSTMEVEAVRLVATPETIHLRTGLPAKLTKKIRNHLQIVGNFDLANVRRVNTAQMAFLLSNSKHNRFAVNVKTAKHLKAFATIGAQFVTVRHIRHIYFLPRKDI